MHATERRPVVRSSLAALLFPSISRRMRSKPSLVFSQGSAPLMLIAYVSDERYVALPDVLLELEGEAGSFEARSRATGAVHVEVPSGHYKVTLQKPGFGAKSVHLQITPGREPYQLRLLADGLLGYAWPKWVKAGEKSEFRVHSVEPYHLSLWRYGIRKELIREIGWFDEHGPRATMQITPDGDYTQTGVEWNKYGYANPLLHQYVTAPERSGLYYFHARTKSGSEFSFPWIVAPARPTATSRGAGVEHHLERL